MVKTVAYEEFRNEYRALTKEIRRLSDDRIEAYSCPPGETLMQPFSSDSTGQLAEQKLLNKQRTLL